MKVEQRNRRDDGRQQPAHGHQQTREVHLQPSDFERKYDHQQSFQRDHCQSNTRACRQKTKSSIIRTVNTALTSLPGRIRNADPYSRFACTRNLLVKTLKGIWNRTSAVRLGFSRKIHTRSSRPNASVDPSIDATQRFRTRI